MADYKLEDGDIRGQVKLPYIRKHVRIMGPGVHNRRNYSGPVVQKIFQNTEWNKNNRACFSDHEDKKSKHWVGEFKNVTLEGDEVFGDMWILDEAEAIKLHYGAPFGISPKIAGKSNPMTGDVVNGRFENQSIVWNPAVKTNYLNSEEGFEFDPHYPEIFVNHQEEEKTMPEETKQTLKEGEDKGKPEVETPAESELQTLKEENAKLKEKLEAMKKPPEEDKKEEDEEEKEDKKEEMSEKKEESKAEFSLEDFLNEHISDKTWGTFVSEQREKNPKITLRDLATQYAKDHKLHEFKAEMSAMLEDKLEKFKLSDKPEPVGNPQDLTKKNNEFVANLSDAEADEGFAQFLERRETRKYGGY